MDLAASAQHLWNISLNQYPKRLRRFANRWQAPIVIVTTIFINRCLFETVVQPIGYPRVEHSKRELAWVERLREGQPPMDVHGTQRADLGRVG